MAVQDHFGLDMAEPIPPLVSTGRHLCYHTWVNLDPTVVLLGIRPDLMRALHSIDIYVSRIMDDL